MEISALVTQASDQMQKMLEAQLAMQQAAQEYSSQSTMSKLEFDTVKSGIERLSSVGEAISRLTDQQSQQISQ